MRNKRVLTFDDFFALKSEGDYSTDSTLFQDIPIEKNPKISLPTSNKIVSFLLEVQKMISINGDVYLRQVRKAVGRGGLPKL